MVSDSAVPAMIASVIIPTRNRPRPIVAGLDAMGRQAFTSHAHLPALHG
jgi:hypothetical protein